MTTLPTKDTTYYCKLIPLPNDRDYHLIATEPIIRSDVIHHIDVYGCTEQGKGLFTSSEMGAKAKKIKELTTNIKEKNSLSLGVNEG